MTRKQQYLQAFLGLMDKAVEDLELMDYCQLLKDINGQIKLDINFIHSKMGEQLEAMGLGEAKAEIDKQTLIKQHIKNEHQN